MKSVTLLNLEIMIDKRPRVMAANEKMLGNRSAKELNKKVC